VIDIKDDTALLGYYLYLSNLWVGFFVPFYLYLYSTIESTEGIYCILWIILFGISLYLLCCVAFIISCGPEFQMGIIIVHVIL